MSGSKPQLIRDDPQWTAHIDTNKGRENSHFSPYYVIKGIQGHPRGAKGIKGQFEQFSNGSQIRGSDQIGKDRDRSERDMGSRTWPDDRLNGSSGAELIRTLKMENTEKAVTWA